MAARLRQAGRTKPSGCRDRALVGRQHVPRELFAADLSDEQSTKRALADIVARHQVTGLVNNAGLNHIQKLGAIDLAKFDAVIAVNLRAAIQCAQAVLPAMERAQFGRIVNITSRALLGRATTSSYTAAKAGLAAITRSWALELADKGITVNAVGPGPDRDRNVE